MVSKTLEAHFKNMASSPEIDAKLEHMLKFIDPEYIDSFKAFRSNLLGIISENPDSEEIVLDNLDEGILGLSKIDQNYNDRNSKAIELSTSNVGIDELREYSKSRKR